MFKSLRAEGLLVLGAALFALNGVVSKLVLESGLSAWRLTQVRCTGAFLILLLFVAARKGVELKPTRAELPWLAAYGIVGFALVQVGYFIAIARMHVSIALIIEFTAPIWIVLYIRFVRKKHVPITMWLALIFGFLGLLLITQVWKGLTLDAIGLIAAFLDAFALAGYFLLGEKLVVHRSTDTLTVWGLGFASLVWVLITPVWSFPYEVFTRDINLLGKFSEYSVPGWVPILWIVVAGTILPYLFVLSGLRHLSASTSSMIGMLEPLVAGIIAWWWLRETLTVIQLIGGAVVIIGIVLADRARRQAV
ncbi:MAG: EamA family transporter [Actinobacteria bacterium]|nr:EamA family transporter [Actinomycetota bacterium]